MGVPMLDLRAEYLSLRAEIDAAVARVLQSGWYILGEEVAGFEAEFAALLGAAACVGVGSGTDALHLALRACGVGPGDEVITVSHTAIATLAAISLTGATPVLVDIAADTYTLDPGRLEAALSPRTRAIVPVHLYGHPADMEPILAVAARAGIRVVEDCAQAHGARYHGGRVGTLGDLGCYSFYPTKNLGALGDGGAVVGNDVALVEQVRLLREYGWTPQARYVSQIVGLNSRLDEIQAAVLRIKLTRLAAWNRHRRVLAQRYGELLPPQLLRPVERPGCEHVYHLYVVRSRARDRLRATLAAAGVTTAVHYPLPAHLQPAYRHLTLPPAGLPVTEQAAREVLSLPIHSTTTLDQVAEVAQAAGVGW